MRTRAWRGWDDLPPTQALLAAALADPATCGFLHTGDLAWWVGWPPKSDTELAELILVVEDEDRLIAWAMYDGDHVGEMVAVDLTPDRAAEARSLIDEWLGNDSLAAREARDDDAVSIARLVAAGYERVEEDGMQAFEIDLDAFDDAEPDSRVRPVAAGDDLRARCAVTHGAFGVDRPFDRYVEQYAAFMVSPAYPPGWDLVAWTDDGTAAACAIAWPDPVSGIGNFEPVATLPAMQRRGYGTAVLREGCRRLRAAGMRRAMVRTPVTNHAARALYRSAGFAESHVEEAFRRVPSRRR